MACINKRVKTVRLTSKPAKAPPERLPWPRTAEDDPSIQLGIDVKQKMPDIIRIVHKFFRVQDVPMEELLQEVYATIIHKNHTRSACDLRKSSFSHYVFMIANNVCINFANRKKRYDRERDSIDAPAGDDDSRTLLDTDIMIDHRDDDVMLEQMKDIEIVMRKRGMRDPARYIRAVRSGANSDVIREALSWGDRRLSSKMMRDIRMQIKDVIDSMADSCTESAFA